MAIAAQGFLDPRPEPFAATMRHVQRVVDRVGVVQIDSVNVLARSHYLPFFSRLGPYDTALLDRARDRAPRRLVEYWAHEASLIPPSTWPLLDFRMRAAAEKAWGGMRRILEERPDFVDVVRAEVEARGPMTTRELRGGARARPAATHRPLGLELVRRQAGARVPLLGRADQLRRAHDPVRAAVCRPARHRAAAAAGGVDATVPGPRPTRERYVELVRIAARAHGIGTELCLADYFRIKREDARPAIARLVADGELHPRDGAGLEAGLAARRGPTAAPRPRRGAAQPLRLARVAARADPRPLGLPLPHRDLHAGAEARARLLRPALPLRRRPSSRAATSRPTARPGCSGATASPGSPALRPRPARHSWPTSSRWPRGSACPGSTCRRSDRGAPPRGGGRPDRSPAAYRGTAERGGALVVPSGGRIA